MAFNRIEKSAFAGRHALPNRVTVTRSIKTDQVQITISRDVLTKLGSPAFVGAFLGTGVDKGALLLTPAVMPKNAYKVTSNNAANGGAMRVNIAGSRLGIDYAIPVTEAEYSITDQGLVVWLPKRPVAGNGIHAENSAQASQWPTMQQPRYAALDNV
jgi:hypothetical protein